MQDKFIITFRDGAFMEVEGEEIMLIAVYNHTKDIMSLKRITNENHTTTV